MTTQKPHPIIRLLPSLTDVAFLMPLVFLFLILDGAKTMLGDGDTGWHIRTGEWILANGRVPTEDLFSFTKEGQPWYAWEWGWDVLFGWLHMHWGMEAVVLGSTFVLCLTFALLYRLALRRCENAFIAIAVTLVAIGASSIHWLARPHLFTLLFVVIFLAILDRVQEGRTRLLFALPLLTILWTNLHGGFFVGIILIGAHAAGHWVTAALGATPEERGAALRRSLPYAATAIACLLASLVNPYGYQLHLHIIEYLREPYHREYISEFGSPSFHPSFARYLECALAAGLFTALWNARKLRFADALLIAAWAHLALIAGRNVPIYVLVAMPAVAEAASECLESLRGSKLAGWVRTTIAAFQQNAVEFSANDRVGRLHIVSAALFALLTVPFYSPAANIKFKAEFDPARYPAKAIELLRSPEFARSVYTDDEWGDYLVYRLFPDFKVFIDGRSDFYGPELGKSSLGLEGAQYDWRRTLSQKKIDTVLLPALSPLATVLKESTHWTLLHDDGVAVVFKLKGKAGAPRATEGAPSFAVTSSGKNRDREITSLQAVISRSPKSNH